MARIFLSYARDDMARAERIAAALEEAGHQVWWDREIAAGSSFSNEIDTALNDAQLVVVLWSRQSIQSDWVRDEAAIGRDSGRLVPVVIDDVLPPLGFRQYQAIPLMGRGRQGAGPLLKAIDRKLNREPKRERDKAEGGRFALPGTAVMVAIAVLLLAAIAGWWLIRPKGTGTSIVVATSGGDPAQSSDLARSLARDLGRIRAGPLATLEILDDPRAKGADYRVEVAVTGSGRQREADVALKKRGTSGLLWSGLIEDSSGNAVDMRQQAAAQVGEILTCLAELSGQERKIAESSLALYLHGCARSNDPDAVNALKDLTRREPRFGPGWANLALAAAWRVETSIAADRPGLVAQAKAALARAKALSPDLPETAVADAAIVPSGGLSDARALAILDKALQRHPDSPLLRGTRAAYLQSLGRMEESVAESARALDLNPLSPELLNIRALYLAYAGRPDAALSELEEAERIWPGSERIASARFALDLRFGDPRRAMEYLDRASAALMPKDIQTYRDFLAARAEPTPANVDRALSHYRDRYERDFAAVPGFLQALVIFGRVDDAYEVAAPDVAADSLSAGSDIFFRPYMAKFRADPRFIRLAKRMGLVDAWIRTGVWPDFCREPGLPYDCKAEASKLRGVRDVTDAATVLK